jgi:plasmid maintenance system antidote protein VapI
MTGQELQQRRAGAGVKAFEVAAIMRVHSSRVSQIEALARVTDDTAARYLSALGQCLVAKTSAPVGGA